MKKCPYCAEMIQDEAIKCRYCGSMLNGSVPPSTAVAASDPVADEARQRLLVEGKIDVIKFVRERTGLGLAEAKAYVEALQAGQEPNTAAVAKTKSSGCTPIVVFIVVLIAGLAMFILLRSR